MDVQGSAQKFITFGCWNNLNGDGTNLESVIAKLKTEIQETNPNFIIISGDNYYPYKEEKEEKKEKKEKKDISLSVQSSIEPKKEKEKIIKTELLERGINLLSDIDTPIYMVLGNHDLETNVIDKKPYYIDSVIPENLEPVGSCYIVENEKRVTGNIDKIKFQLNNSIMFGEKTLILMIDTSMYDDDDAPEFKVCYNKFNVNNDELSVIREKQRAFINETIEQHKSENIQNLIIVGHHPITAVKIKKSNILIEPFKEFLNVLLSIPREGFNPKYYYLCADLHSYQIGNIDITDTTNNKTIGITQYVVGNGGTKLDPLFLDEGPIQNIISENNEGKFMSDENYSTYNVKYTMTSSQIDASTRGYSHGFLECSLLENDNLEFEFIRVDGQRIRERTNIGGGNRKRKHKYFMNIIKTLKKRLSKIKSKRRTRPKKRVRTQKKIQKRKLIRTMRK
jgi:hypothetical protein